MDRIPHEATLPSLSLAVDPSGHVTLAWLDRQGARIAFWTDER
jgi:hypothetical protein